MKRSHRSWSRVARLALPVLALPTVAAAAPDLARCAAIGAADERLACYDALSCGAIAAADERLACFDALAKSRAARPHGVVAAPPSGAGAAGAPAAGAPAALPGDAGSFGRVQRPTPSPRAVEGVQQITAVVTQVETDMQGVVHVSLDNGQVWTLINYDRAFPSSGETVTIRRAALGSFLMTTASHRTVRVARTQ